MTGKTDIESILSLMYFHAYHAGHHDTVEGCYTDVHQVDRFEHHRDAVKGMLYDDTEIAELVAAHCMAKPSEAQVPEGWHISRTEDGNIIVQKSNVAGFVASEQSGGIAESTLYYLADDLLTASPAPGHAAEADVCQNCETALPEGCGGIFAHTGTACRYGENQQEEAER